ncbi:MAG TPA: hypothetical protein PLE19_12855 [Planctomycetota bacterium]|nr:hypothetical protein [Planctomycetota bacterium]HRR82927.1 hypothetical protein [Planctomycetota bacterium]HRT94783.1 hypothetical protein [Planctomycetota bacterium]
MKRLDPASEDSRCEWNEALARLCGMNHWAHWHCHACGHDWVRESKNRPCPQCAVTYSQARVEFLSVPDFFAGLNADGTCNEALVDGDLLWRVMRAVWAKVLNLEIEKKFASLQWRVWVEPDPATLFGRGWGTSLHPIVALALAAHEAGLLEEKANG